MSARYKEHYRNIRMYTSLMREQVHTQVVIDFQNEVTIMVL